MDKESFIKQTLASLNFSESFQAMAAAQDFRTLSDIISWPASVLLKHNGFTYHHYQELRNFLIKNDLLHLLKT